MKKILCTLAVVGLASSMFAQGLVSFANNGSTLVKFKSDPNAADATAVAVPVAGGSAQLFWAPAGKPYTPWTPTMAPSAWLTANPDWAAVAGSIKAMGPVPGRFNAGGFTIPTATPGATIQAVVVAWTGNFADFGAAYTAAQAPGATTGVGVSPKFDVATGNPNTTPAGTAASIYGAGQFGGLITSPVAVPEPSTLALLGLGAAALTILRRRK